jgi:hypothetical protein
MPSLRELGMGRSPLADPLSYPGRMASGDALLVGAWLYALSTAPEAGDWRVRVDGGPLASGRRVAATTITLAEALRRLDVAALGERRPMLAVGSNGSPAQLSHKLGAPVVPLTHARVRGLMIGHSAHVSAAGYVPYTAIAAEPEAPPVTLPCLWLDDEQRRRVDATELNYQPITLDHSWLIEASVTFGRAPTLYRSNWGALRAEPSAGALPAGDQPSVWRRLAELAWFRQLVPEHREGPAAVAAALGGDRLRRELVRDRFAETGLAAPDGLAETG